VKHAIMRVRALNPVHHIITKGSKQSTSSTSGLSNSRMWYAMYLSWLADRQLKLNIMQMTSLWLRHTSIIFELKRRFGNGTLVTP
jgi:hypothetical protein